jgi:glycosyltransferase involved in cell wall biosynthesis
MKVLHLFSNSKWTGPAEPALRLCLALRDLGVDVDFACAPGSGHSINKIAETARDAGLEPILDLHLSKHRNAIKNWRDRRALSALVRERGYQLIHCHLENDHRIALGVAKRLRVPLVRSSYEGTGFHDRRHVSLVKGTACLLESSRIAMEHDRRRFKVGETRLAYVAPAVDLERFNPAREVPDGRRRLNVPASAFVVGIVARMQTHRHYEDFFEAVRGLVDGVPQAHVIVVGRGTKSEQVCMEPVRRLGLEGRVHFPGFIEGDDYVGMVKAFDVKVFMKPGTDGTCRAVREAMAMGKPAVVADRGMLRELVDDGVNGVVFDGSAKTLRDALVTLARDRERVRDYGKAARDKAVREWSQELQARKVLGVYEQLLA